ncbi:MAG: formylmethanofuran dehydrogenase subunit E family protein [Methanothrix sp.]
MNQATSACKYTGIDRDYSIEDLAAFHGHLGPYIVLGYRMGRYARKNFCSDPFQMKAAVFCEGVPPESCLADGVQIGSGCTLGKRNIDIIAGSDIRCEFSCGERKMIIGPRQIAFPPQSGDDSDQLIEKLAEDMFSMPDAELFTAILRQSSG